MTPQYETLPDGQVCVQLAAHKAIFPTREQAEKHAQLILPTFKRKTPRKIRRELQRGGLSPDKHNEALAIRYARWLAQRDGIKINGEAVYVEWGRIYSKWRKYQSWDGLQEEPASVKRVRAVLWSGTRIEIPHWDFEHNPPQDEGESAC